MTAFNWFNNTVPAGVDPEYYFQSRQVGVTISSSFFIVMCISLIVLRVVARRMTSQPLLLDDWLAFVALPFTLMSPIMALVRLWYGFGRHNIVAINTSKDFVIKSGINIFIVIFAYNAAIALVKLSLLALYWRLFAVMSWVRYAIGTIAAAVVMWCITIEFTNLFRCSPISVSWNFLQSGKCILASNQHYWLQAVPSVVFDVAILCIPPPLFLKARMSKRSRTGLIALFLLSGVLTIISVLRIYSRVSSTYKDNPYNGIVPTNWSNTELFVGLLSACFLTYGPLIRKVVDKMGFFVKPGGGSKLSPSAECQNAFPNGLAQMNQAHRKESSGEAESEMELTMASRDSEYDV